MNLLIDIKILIYASSAVFALLIIGFLVIFLLRTKKINTKKEVQIDDTYIESIYAALGRKDNIENIRLDNKRLKVLLKDTKIIKVDVFKKLETPAFLVGKELKILVKYSPELVLAGLNKKRDEVL